MEKMLIISIFSSSQNVFKRLFLCGKGLNHYHTARSENDPLIKGFENIVGKGKKC